MFKKLLCLIGGLIIVAGCDTDVNESGRTLSSDSIKVGMIIPTTGSLASLGLTSRNSAQLAVKEINDAGGIGGQQIELIIRDSRIDGPTGVAAAQELRDLGVVAIIGAAASSVTLFTSQNQTIADGIPLISPFSTSPLIAELNDNNTVWRTIASDAFQGVILADLLISDNVSTVSGFFRDDPYGSGLFAAFKQRFESQGGTVLAEVSYPGSKEFGFNAEIQALLANGTPEAIVAITFFTDGGNFTRDLVAAGQNNIQLYGVDGNFGVALINNGAPQVLEGMKGTAPVPPKETANYQTFFNNFESTFGFEPDVFGESSYDAVYLIALSMLQGGAATKESIINNLQSVSRPDGSSAVIITPNQFATAISAVSSGSDIDYEGASGAIGFDNNGDVTSGTYVVWQIQSNSGNLEFAELEVISIP
ncbi:ABC transporter substrate-binding protein [Pleionea sp. CnH1-48]|uniref:ABC transporter substrate-binding protein n=1 Tax=Pleionea sp. CnH1-48 TaxID=2954494 RepID=UPI002098098B|nr:ABC transporter substrate-binding protein [Pleionea sp. CnH1-48]MCO7225485.1 ABC transporter substrate-binding protein [Pleionea sp. CnH1-48]